MALEIHDAHENNSHSAAYAAAAALAGAALAAGIWYCTKGRGTDALPALERELDLFPQGRLLGEGNVPPFSVPGYIKDLAASSRTVDRALPLLNTDLETLLPNHAAFDLSGGRLVEAEELPGGAVKWATPASRTDELRAGLIHTDPSNVPLAEFGPRRTLPKAASLPTETELQQRYGVSYNDGKVSWKGNQALFELHPKPGVPQRPPLVIGRIGADAHNALLLDAQVQTVAAEVQRSAAEQLRDLPGIKLDRSFLNEMDSYRFDIPPLNGDDPMIALNRPPALGLAGDVSKPVPSISSRAFPMHLARDSEGNFDIAAFFRMCDEAPPGITKFDLTGSTPKVVGHIPFGNTAGVSDVASETRPIFSDYMQGSQSRSSRLWTALRDRLRGVVS